MTHPMCVLDAKRETLRRYHGRVNPYNPLSSVRRTHDMTFSNDTMTAEKLEAVRRDPDQVETE